MSESQIVVRLNPDVPPTGSDLGVVNAARRSFNKRSDWDYDLVEKKGYDGEWYELKKNPHLKDSDKRLIEFLARGMAADDFEGFIEDLSIDGQHYVKGEWIEKLWQWRNTPTHDTPFNHGFISFEVKAPIFVRAQLVKHEYLIMSEFSRRYITDDIEFYRPDYWRKAAENKKQGSLEEPVIGNINGKPWGNGYYGTITKTATTCYNDMVAMGVAPEQARMVLPQSTMTEWTWSGTLGAFSKMCQLRLHPDAQYEARLVAQQVYTYLKEYWPISAKALVEGV